MFITYLDDWKVLPNILTFSEYMNFTKKVFYILFLFSSKSRKTNLLPDKRWKIWKPLDFFYPIGREILYARCLVIHRSIYVCADFHATYVKTAKIYSNYFYVQFSKKTPYHVKRLWSRSFWGPQWPELINFVQKLWGLLPSWPVYLLFTKK